MAVYRMGGGGCLRGLEYLKYKMLLNSFKTVHRILLLLIIALYLQGAFSKSKLKTLED